MENSRRVSFAMAILALAVPAFAVKPQPPVAAVCATVDQKGFVYTAECRVETHGDHIPAHVRVSATQEQGTLIVKSQAQSANGIGKWTIVFEAHEQKPIPVYFDANYPDGTTTHVTAIYDPHGVLTKPKTGVPTGVVKENKGGGKVKEYPSN